MEILKGATTFLFDCLATFYIAIILASIFFGSFSIFPFPPFHQKDAEALFSISPPVAGAEMQQWCCAKFLQQPYVQSFSCCVSIRKKHWEHFHSHSFAWHLH